MAKRRYENVTLFGRSFELDTKDTIGYESIPHRDIHDVYGRPSQTKVNIYDGWAAWFNENNGWCDVCSHNCNFFSIQGYVRDMENRKMYFCYITPSHNKCIEVKEELM